MKVLSKKQKLEDAVALRGSGVGPRRSNLNLRFKLCIKLRVTLTASGTERAPRASRARPGLTNLKLQDGSGTGSHRGKVARAGPQPREFANPHHTPPAEALEPDSEGTSSRNEPASQESMQEWR